MEMYPPCTEKEKGLPRPLQRAVHTCMAKGYLGGLGGPSPADLEGQHRRWETAKSTFSSSDTQNTCRHRHAPWGTKSTLVKNHRRRFCLKCLISGSFVLHLKDLQGPKNEITLASTSKHRTPFLKAFVNSSFLIMLLALLYHEEVIVEISGFSSVWPTEISRPDILLGRLFYSASQRQGSVAPECLGNGVTLTLGTFYH